MSEDREYLRRAIYVDERACKAQAASPFTPDVYSPHEDELGEAVLVYSWRDSKKRDTRKISLKAFAK